MEYGILEGGGGEGVRVDVDVETAEEEGGEGSVERLRGEMMGFSVEERFCYFFCLN